jgi:hypothetical protein
MAGKHFCTAALASLGKALRKGKEGGRCSAAALQLAASCVFIHPVGLLGWGEEPRVNLSFSVFFLVALHVNFLLKQSSL